MSIRSFIKYFLLFFTGALLMLGLLGCGSAPRSQPESQGLVPEVSLEIPRVSLEESKAAFDSGTAVFLDVRSASSYAAGHIPGALSIPLAELEGRIGELDPTQWIITYCT